MIFRRPATAGYSINYLASGTEVQGSIKSDGSLRVDGVIYGNVEVKGDLEIAATGRIEGSEVRAGNIVCQGGIKGQITADGKVTITATARVEGDVVASAIDIAAGAFFVGHIVTRENKSLPGPGRNKPQLSSSQRALEPGQPPQ